MRGLLEEMVTRYKPFVDHVKEVTVVFDKGNNAQDILERLDGSPFHFVGSLVPTQHEELLAIPLKQMRRLDRSRLPKVRAYRTRKVVFGAERPVLVAHNATLLRAQTRTLTREISKRLKKLRAMARRLQLWRDGRGRGRRPTLASTKTAIAKTLVGRHMKLLVQVNVTEGAVASCTSAQS